MGVMSTVTTPNRPLLVWLILVVALIAATVGLWARYGAAVFIDALVAGWTACFG